MRYRNILFDLDGTLTDSGEGIMQSAAYAFETLGLPVPGETELRKMVGPPLSTSFAFLGVPEDQVEEAICLYRDRYNNHGGRYLNHVYPGIEELLSQLRDAGFRLYVATSKHEELAREILTYFGLAPYFEYIAGATLDHSRNTKSAVLSYLLDRIGRDQNTVMIGDTTYDVIGAKEQNLPCIGVSWGYGNADDMKAEGAEAIVETAEMLREYLCK